ncbi:Gfo/Idh/MocA family oxidoreductase [Dactylosporangium sp. AC04546]|uniref:Gfo/Idh/MocA family protein n=1 Tax=Dactylosporangium sp. AC04546 TaxID=2862460 RepID=UPI001EDDBF53|nr:Gfo/Idh/MocA family oxidoreductase [Dactylosporangium sp. AC04546]WVK88647.1 Gfo/Idh/MocA family oxidoreductase [Dactylosporangium sp. AC04546]
MTELRIGILGAARIAPAALIRPARLVPGVTVAAVAARDPARGAAFARRHGIPTVHPGYAELVDDPGLDAVYVPLPNGLHAEWTLAALDAGKHVLCEKPLTSNADQARRIAAATGANVVMEAFHYRYHPLMRRALELVPRLGELRHVETSMCFPLPRFSDIRYDLRLAGGASMDAGCYAVHALRTLSGQEPAVVAARALLAKPGVDRAMVVDYAFPGGATGRTTASLWSRHVLRLSARVTGANGTLKLSNYLMPSVYHRLTVTIDGRTRRERVPGEATYTHQLRAFADAVLRGGPNLTPPGDAVRTMELIDAAYRAAGLDPRT